MAVQFPAFCAHCGLIFESRLIGFGEGARVEKLTLEGNLETCPRCGKWAELPEGTFNIVGETIQVLSASQLTRERLQRLAAILERARTGEISEAAARQAVEDEAPAFRPIMERFGPRMRKAWVFLLLAIFNALIAQGIAELRDDAATRADLERTIEEVLERCREGPP